MGAYKVIITKQAQKHLRIIYEYIAVHLNASGLAKSLMAVLFFEIEKLKTNPSSAPFVTEEPWCEYGIRKIVIKKYLVYFFIDEKRKEVGILGVIYQDKKEQDALCPPSYIKKEVGFDQIIQFRKNKRNRKMF